MSVLCVQANSSLASRRIAQVSRNNPQVARLNPISRSQRRSEIRHRLRVAAATLMALDQSYTALSVERIVKEAGISRATFYIYFEDKGDLLRALAEDGGGGRGRLLRTALRTLFGSLLERTIGEVAHHIAAGHAQGFVAPGLDPQRTAAWLTWMAEPRALPARRTASSQASERLLTALTDITWNTLYAKPGG